MHLGIDASNLTGGGGLTHLIEILRAADPISHGFRRVTVWSRRGTLKRIEDRPWLIKDDQPLLEKGLACRALWRRFRLSQLARAAGCNVLFVPGGTHDGDFSPVVTMSRNMLPFEWWEMRRYGFSRMFLRLLILRMTQTSTFRRADGLIFLTRFARDIVLRKVKTTRGLITIVPHGVDARFFCAPREQRPIGEYSVQRPFRLIYVSIIDAYKHQWQTVKAVGRLRKEGLPVVLDLVGPAYSPSLKRLRKTIDRVDPTGEFTRYVGEVPYTDLPAYYAQANMCLFASSCENMPNILLEYMASGLPIACSNRGPMPEMLGSSAVYFDPEKPTEIFNAIKNLIEDCGLRNRNAKAAFDMAKAYAWRDCSQKTFDFLRRVANRSTA